MMPIGTSAQQRCVCQGKVFHIAILCLWTSFENDDLWECALNHRQHSSKIIQNMSAVISLTSTFRLCILPKNLGEAENDVKIICDRREWWIDINHFRRAGTRDPLSGAEAATTTAAYSPRWFASKYFMSRWWCLS